MRILIFDNYDSFTYNLVHIVEKIIGQDVDVFRNDKISIEEVGMYDKILLSPGPGLPSESGILNEVIKKYAPVKSIFGVCLGLQAMVEVFGGKLLNLSEVYHGIATPVNITDSKELIFKEIPDRFMAGRYHSWVADPASLPDCFRLTAEDDNNLVMGIRHNVYDLSAVQFHPESILTEYGEKMIANWLKENQKVYHLSDNKVK
ncbi:MAG: aminodeoxychorismate/anthranilate synthase component II [Bacteroidetes bacterium HGW-Bacteroidetes-1]|jgi:anthranilate synthase component 2|nr:MAG: aminodeoxychorismate/anthranilate synthase component II [Bacteroidetes bacterium HGW-Bacteroidetes-1]